LNRIPVHALMAPKQQDKRSLAAKREQSTGQSDLLQDRGSPHTGFLPSSSTGVLNFLVG